MCLSIYLYLYISVYIYLSIYLYIYIYAYLEKLVVLLVEDGHVVERVGDGDRVGRDPQLDVHRLVGNPKYLTFFS